MRYPIAIEPRTERSEYGVVIPDLPGAFSAGETLDEAIAGAEEPGLRGSTLRSTQEKPFLGRRRSNPSARDRNLPAGFCRS
jgi:hypothetical protein